VADSEECEEKNPSEEGCAEAPGTAPWGKTRSRPTIPPLVVEQKGRLSYAEILSRIRKDDALKDVGTSVQRMRRTNAGHLLIVLTKESSARTSELHKAVQDAFKEQAEVRSRVQELDQEHG